MRRDTLDLGEVVSPGVTARLYALRLAKYISDPSTVRARVIDECGHAPSRAAIAGMIAARPRRRAPGLSEIDEIAFAPATKPEPIPAAALLPSLLPAAAPILRHERVVCEIERVFGLPPGSIRASGRKPKVARGRHVAVAVLRGVGLTCNQVGRMLGGRDHSTIVNSQARFLMHADDEMRALAERLIAEWPTMLGRPVLSQGQDDLPGEGHHDG